MTSLCREGPNILKGHNVGVMYEMGDNTTNICNNRRGGWHAERNNVWGRRTS